MQRAISVFNCDMSSQNKTINDKIKILNKTLFIIFNNFIPNKISKFDLEKTGMDEQVGHITFEEKIESYKEILQ